jgi:hypothetical protein
MLDLTEVEMYELLNAGGGDAADVQADGTIPPQVGSTANAPRDPQHQESKNVQSESRAGSELLRAGTPRPGDAETGEEPVSSGEITGRAMDYVCEKAAQQLREEFRAAVRHPVDATKLLRVLNTILAERATIVSSDTPGGVGPGGHLELSVSAASNAVDGGVALHLLPALLLEKGQ